MSPAVTIEPQVRVAAWAWPSWDREAEDIRANRAVFGLQHYSFNPRFSQMFEKDLHQSHLQELGAGNSLFGTVILFP